MKRPIIIIGMGRSGSTIFFEAFSRNSDLMSFTNITNHYPSIALLAFVNRLTHQLGEKPQGQKITLLNKFVPKYSEAYKTWNYYFGKDFSTTFNLDNRENSTQVDNFRNYVQRLLLFSGKNKFTAKLTGPPRINFLGRVFENKPIFIDVVRDPRAVVSSLLKVDYWHRKGINNPHWTGSLSKNDMSLLKEKFDSSPIALASLEWRNIYKQTQIELSREKVDYLRIKYEDFISNPLSELEKALSFSNLQLTTDIQDHVKSTTYSMNNFKYKENFTDKEINIIEEICFDEMNEIGYR